jgi:hypothetical protein
MSRSRCACGRSGPLFGGSCLTCVRAASARRGGRAPLKTKAKPRFGSIRRPEVPDTFTQSYIETALWSSTDNSDDSGGDPLDQNYSASDLTVDTLRAMVEDCKKFQAENSPMLARAYVEGKGARGRYDAGSAGHDFWLTRNGHGAGFWDGDLPKDVGEALTRASKKFGEFDLSVERGKIYGSQPRTTKSGGHTKGTPSKSEMVPRKKLGELMGPWGSDMSYGVGSGSVGAVGSYYSVDKVYPDRKYVEQALAEVEKDEPLAMAGAHGWTKKDAAELRKIAGGLRHYLRTDYK